MRQILVAFISAVLIFTGGCSLTEKVANENHTEDTKVTEFTEMITETVIELTTAYLTYIETSSIKTETRISEKCDSDIVDLINGIRIENDIKPLALSSKLCCVAEIRAQEASGLWSHTRPDGSKINKLADEYDVEWMIIGENLAKHKNASTENIVEAWMNSKAHRNNILNTKFRMCGIGEYVYDSTIYISFVFTD